MGRSWLSPDRFLLNTSTTFLSNFCPIELTPRDWLARMPGPFRFVCLERERAELCGGCLSCGSPPHRMTCGDTSGRSPRRAIRGRAAPGARQEKGEPAGGWMRASLTMSESGGVRELSRGEEQRPPASARVERGGPSRPRGRAAEQFVYLVQEETVLALPDRDGYHL